MFEYSTNDDEHPNDQAEVGSLHSFSFADNTYGIFGRDRSHVELLAQRRQRSSSYSNRVNAEGTRPVAQENEVLGVEIGWHQGGDWCRHIMRYGDAERNACAFTPVIRADKDQEQLSFVGENMYALELSVSDENNIIVAYAKVLGLAHVSESVSWLSKGAHELHLRIKNLYARIHHIGYKEPTILGSGDARWEVEPT